MARNSRRTGTVTACALLLLGALSGRVMAEEAAPKPGDANFVWDNNTYMKQFIQKMSISEQRPTGVGGGKPLRVEFPSTPDSAQNITRIHVFHDKRRVYGLQFDYDAGGQQGQTVVIGGNAGEESTVDISWEHPLFAIRGHYAYDKLQNSKDPDAHYVDPILMGLSIDVYKQNVLSTPSAPGVTHEQLLTTYNFGNTRPRDVVTPPEGLGFDVYLLQGVRAINACVSPLDRNGRIFSLGVQTFGLMGDRTREDPATWCSQDETQWARQPLGPPRLKTLDAFGDEVRPVFDPYAFASGLYRKKIDGEYKVVSGDLRDPAVPFRVSRPEELWVEFGDVATIRFGGLPQPEFRLPLVTDEKERGDYDFMYKARYDGGDVWVGVTIEEGRSPRNYDYDTGEFRRTRYANLTFSLFHKNAQRFAGDYIEVPLQGAGGKRAKRNLVRGDVRDAGQSQSGLFEISNVISGYGHLFSGYDFLELSLESYTKGRKANIFEKSGDYQYYLPTNGPKAVPDGIYYIDDKFAVGSSRSFSISSASSLTESTSMNLGGSVPVKGVPVGLNYSSSESRARNENRSMSRSFQAKRGLQHIFVTDSANAFLNSDFARDYMCLYRSIAAGRACNKSTTELAGAMVDQYGTHFPQAIGYGGRAIQVEKTSSREIAEEVKQSKGISASIGGQSSSQTKQGQNGDSSTKSTPGPSGSAGWSQEKNTYTGSTNSLSEAKFSALGGSGNSFESWSVSPDNAVPILYDLRKLSELMEPIIFRRAAFDRLYEGEYSGADMAKARAALDVAIDAYVDKHAQRNVAEPLKPYLYTLELSDFKCTDNGNDDGDISMYGKFLLRYNDSGVLNEDVPIWSPEGTSVKCNSTQITEAQMPSIMLQFEPGPSATPDQMQPALLMVDKFRDSDGVLYEDDPVTFDGDNFILLGSPPVAFDSPVTTTFQFGGDKVHGSPTFRITATWTRIAF
ncbi:MAG: hypothetical protein H6994_11775 [Pseudomonadales bacterium]|nr:hypothetical protein [Pseudomonadales bacterium]